MAKSFEFHKNSAHYQDVVILWNFLELLHLHQGHLFNRLYLRDLVADFASFSLNCQLFNSLRETAELLARDDLI